MNVLVDYVGHADLFYSMHKLFSERLGWDLYRPEGGNKWRSHGVRTQTLPSYASVGELKDGIKEIDQDFYGYSQKAITFDKFLKLDIGLIVSTSSENEAPLLNVQKRFKSSAKYVRQIANVRERPTVARNVLLSMTTSMSQRINWIRYHPEHHDRFYYDPNLTPPPNIKSFFNYFLDYGVELKTWRKMKGLMPNFQFLMHGARSELGGILPVDLPQAMQEATFIWHTKPMGCCGYVARQALSCGKPLIVKKKYARQCNTMATEYLAHGHNCIDLDVVTLQKAKQMLLEWAKPDQYHQRCQEVVRMYNQSMNYADEAETIREWIGKL